MVRSNYGNGAAHTSFTHPYRRFWYRRLIAQCSAEITVGQIVLDNIQLVAGVHDFHKLHNVGMLRKRRAFRVSDELLSIAPPKTWDDHVH